jgi:hypothetical protein
MRAWFPVIVLRRAPVRRRRSLAIASLLLLSLVAPLLQVRAQENDATDVRDFVGGFQYHQPFHNAMSGEVWLQAQGFDLSDPATWQLAGAGGGGSAPAASNQQVPFRNPAPAFSRNLIVSRNLGPNTIQTEPQIAVDPKDPEHLVMGAIDYNLGPGIAIYTSFDGGETWDGPNRLRFFREDFGFGGDPVITFDQTGAVYISAISVGFEEFRLGTVISFASTSSMLVARSDDGGLTWDEPVAAARGLISTVSNIDSEGKERGTLTLPFLDKEWIDAGPDPEDPSKDILYLSYTEFKDTYSLIYADEVPYLSSPVSEATIRVVASRDNGVTWSEPVDVSPTVLSSEGANAPGGEGERAIGPLFGGGAVDSIVQANEQGESQQPGQITQETGGTTEANRTVQGSQPKVMADGTVVVAYLDTTNDGIQEGLFTIQIVRSFDGGKTFTDSKSAGVFREPHFQPRTANFRYWGAAFPQVAVGPGNEIYILTTALPPDKATDDGDIYLMRSFDRGETWEEPARLNTDATDALQFFPSIDVSPNGIVHAMWGDMRDDPNEVRYHVYYSRSEDKGETWGFTIPEQNFTAPDTRVTDFGSNHLRGFPGGQFIGDYFSIAATDGDVYLVWADTRQGEFSAATQGIGFARQTAIESPSLFLNPPSGSAGRTVDIQGFGFQPESNIQLLVSGVITANPRTDEKGQFQTSIYMPVTGEGPTSISAYDDTGNTATASFFTEFGFDSLQESLDAINDKLAGQGQGTESTNVAASPVTTGPASSSLFASPVAITEVTPAASPTARPASSLFSSTPAASPVGSPAASPVASPIASPDASPESTPDT